MKTDEKFPILIIDGHRLVRQGLKELLAESFESVASGEASTVADSEILEQPV